MRVYLQKAMNEEFLAAEMDACPRENEYIMLKEGRFRVCQVQHRQLKQSLTAPFFSPFVLLQEEL